MGEKPEFKSAFFSLLSWTKTVQPGQKNELAEKMEMHQTKSSVLDVATRYLNAGLSVIPIRGDGTKAPTVPWKPYQECPPDSGEVLRWFTGREDLGVGILG